MRPVKIALVPLCLALSACATFPEVDAATSAEIQQAAYPAFLPLEAILGAVPPPPEGDPASEVEAQANALKARAERIRRIDPSA